MKKLLFIFIVFASCDPPCTLAQIPNQVVYADSECKAILPNYVPMARVVGGCTGYVITQTPSPGAVLSITSRTVNVVLKATGANGKAAQITFVVSLADTITPRFVGLTSEQMNDSLIKKSNDLYNIADRMIEKVEQVFNDTFPFAENGLLPKNDYKTKMLIVASKDGLLGRERFITYLDTLSFSMDSIR